MKPYFRSQKSGPRYSATICCPFDGRQRQAALRQVAGRLPGKSVMLPAQLPGLPR